MVGKLVGVARSLVGVAKSPVGVLEDPVGVVKNLVGVSKNPVGVVENHVGVVCALLCLVVLAAGRRVQVEVARSEPCARISGATLWFK